MSDPPEEEGYDVDPIEALKALLKVKPPDKPSKPENDEGPAE